MKLDYAPGATPLEPEELEELIPDLVTQRQLNEFEAQNIASAEQWANRNTRFRGRLLSVPGLLELHKRMFADTWKWAGRFRKSNKNIGSDWPYISEQVQALCGDANYWVKHKSWTWPELAVRFHYRLVSIHPFVNGNGRHARVAANLLLEYNGEPRLPWGGLPLVEEGERRAEYIAALHDADKGNTERLVRFALSAKHYAGS